MLAALDTNVVVYAQGLHASDEPKRQQIIAILADVRPASFVIPAQVLGELYNVLTRKLRRDSASAAAVVRRWQDMFPVVPTTGTILARATDVAVAHGLAIWDAVILAAAAEAGCRLLLSEDMHDGFTWGGVTIVNPFAATPHRLLSSLRRDAR